MTNSNGTAGALPADAPGVVHARHAAARARHAPAGTVVRGGTAPRARRSINIGPFVLPVPRR
ncbi:hypothetical protein WL40_28670 [Burkholderia ubonensis]|uniref:Uncharacterized protein n=2 Tax=Burkholderia cepacia complex TaxID=87882 RepID=A0A1B4PTL0_BURCE|nr:hypothetical protein WT26_15110 [Burkholderia cepacia]AOK23939.1 hypothetical protein WK67_15035 [Burkholderia ubonensis]KVO34263.1 hypothetical protein WJ75_21320 [Burkholderia ubonensis]KVP62862.1 hypothetical protein WJ92_07745 [Burkholderia ubonensis]KVR01427.1 hypothetical protein WK11_20390 [Burkholderia ubonensis]